MRACTRRWRSGPGEGRERGLCQPRLRLTLLAPEIVEAILDGRQPVEMGLDDLLEGFPLDWEGSVVAAAGCLSEPSARPVH